MNIETFLAEFRADNEGWDVAGVIDDVAITKWIHNALKKFGENIMPLYEKVITIEGGKAELPENFYRLYLGYYCHKKGYNIKCQDDGVVQNTMMWIERDDIERKWKLCDPCCEEVEEKLIIERQVICDTEVEFYYHNPIPIKLGKTIKRDVCAKGCRNLGVKSSPYEVVIDGRTLHSNFDEGDLYIQYRGLPLDEKGLVEIPEGYNGTVEDFIENHVYKKICEKLLRNKEDANIASLFNYYVQNERDLKKLALTATKMDSVTPENLRKIKQLNRLDILPYELNFPSI